MADEAKAKGNAAFSSGDYAAAIRHFSDAIALAPTNHVLYSNRFAAHAFLQNYADALADAKKTVELIFSAIYKVRLALISHFFYGS
uniref:Heat shock protein STI n=1 Tax=Cajanus cajan TaxID=3821 RepID=A0A151TJG0_CAJCA|nr:Heat shock protein STI [Cajanus cajan]